MALRDRDADLAEAQRIARLGSWQWDLNTGSQSWSDETYRMLGIDRSCGDTATFEALMSSIHPDDRDQVDGAVPALYNQAPFRSNTAFVCLTTKCGRFISEASLFLTKRATRIRLAGGDSGHHGTEIARSPRLKIWPNRTGSRQVGGRTPATGDEPRARAPEPRPRVARRPGSRPLGDYLQSRAAQRRTFGDGRQSVAIAGTNEEIRQDILAVVVQLRGLVGEPRPLVSQNSG